MSAIPQFARLTGVFAEPSSAAIYAGAKRAIQWGHIHSEERVAFVVTGSGLKDVRRAQQSVSGGLRVKPDLTSIRLALQF